LERKVVIVCGRERTLLDLDKGESFIVVLMAKEDPVVVSGERVVVVG